MIFINTMELKLSKWIIWIMIILCLQIYLKLQQGRILLVLTHLLILIFQIVDLILLEIYWIILLLMLAQEFHLINVFLIGIQKESYKNLIKVNLLNRNYSQHLDLTKKDTFIFLTIVNLVKSAIFMLHFTAVNNTKENWKIIT